MLSNNTNTNTYNTNTNSFFSYNYIIMTVILFHLIIGFIVFLIYYKTRKSTKNSLHIQNVDNELVEFQPTKISPQNISTDLIIDIPPDTLININNLSITPNISTNVELEEDFEILNKETDDDDETVSLLHENIIIQNKYKFI